MIFKAIGFDYGGVISGRPGSEFDKEISALLEVSPKRFKEVYLKYNSLVNTGKISLEDFWQKVTSELQGPEKLERLLGYLRNQPKKEINVEILNLVKKLKKAGYKVGLLTNRTLKIEKPKVAQCFDLVLTSAEIGYSKPDPQAFEIFAKRLNIQPSELIFIDDTPESLTSARKLGIQPILFTNLESLVKELKTLGVLLG